MSVTIQKRKTKTVKTKKEKKRKCVACGSTKTRQTYYKLKDKKGTKIKYPQWPRSFCRNCWDKYIGNPKRSKKDAIRKIYFKTRQIYLKSSPRIEVCNSCRAVVGQINAQLDKPCKTTQMNHFAYHDDSPLKDALEHAPHVMPSTIIITMITNNKRCKAMLNYLLCLI